MTLRVGRGGRSEAFSIRRLGGSRWRLRRTRCAMGFQRQLGSQSFVGRRKKGGLAIGAVLPRAETRSAEDRQRRGGHWVDTRMRRRAWARPRSETDLRVRKN